MTSGADSNRRIALLAGQAFALGLTTAWIAIPASAIFLETYGAGLLPLTYIGAALAGAAASASLGVALRRHPLVSVTMSILASLASVLVACWLLLSRVGAEWVAFALLVLVPIIVPVGFMLVVAQAGMLLDVRALKALYGRVIVGFALRVCNRWRDRSAADRHTRKDRRSPRRRQCCRRDVHAHRRCDTTKISDGTVSRRR